MDQDQEMNRTTRDGLGSGEEQNYSRDKLGSGEEYNLRNGVYVNC